MRVHDKITYAPMNPTRKASVEEIRGRFDRDVGRFSNLETGQTATVDAALALDLIAQEPRVSPAARAMLGRLWR